MGFWDNDFHSFFEAPPEAAVLTTVRALCRSSRALSACSPSENPTDASKSRLYAVSSSTCASNSGSNSSYGRFGARGMLNVGALLSALSSYMSSYAIVSSPWSAWFSLRHPSANTR